MKVRLTSAQLEHVKRLYPAGESWWPLAVRHSADRWDVAMPAIGWRRCFEALERETLTRGGFNRSTVPRPVIRARNEIRRELNALESHPALRGFGVVGRETRFIPVWAAGGTISPYPAADSPMVVLTPRAVERGRNRLDATVWDAESAHTLRELYAANLHCLAARLLDEREHRALASDARQG